MLVDLCMCTGVQLGVRVFQCSLNYLQVGDKALAR